jgi:SAM-dependent methyltransferase
MEQPQIWHYGLMAREWAEFALDGGKEAVYFKAMIETSGQPALDLGCGTGRLLIPLLQAGLDVDGCDFSKDMLAHCEDRAKKAGLSPNLYVQAMHQLDLPRRYRTIFACGALGLGGEQKLAQQAMQRCYDHLRPGGIFVFDYSPRWNDPPAWLSRLPENRHALPQEWPTSGERKLLSDGTVLELVARTVAMDPLEDIATRQIRARLWQNGVLIQEEIHTQMVGDYSKNELVLMLEKSGFREIQVNGNYSDELATADHETLILIAKK